jgi:hypothetical protein
MPFSGMATKVSECEEAEMKVLWCCANHNQSIAR